MHLERRDRLADRVFVVIERDDQAQADDGGEFMVGEFYAPAGAGSTARART